MNDVIFTRGEGSLGRPLPNKDNVSALAFPVLNADLPFGFASNDRCKKVFSLTQAEGLGITATNQNNSVKKTHYHVSEFFRMNPQGELYIYLYAPGTSLNALLTAVYSFPPNGEIRQVAVMTQVDPVAENGDIIPENITGAVDTAQIVANGALQAHKPFSVLLASEQFTADFDLSQLPDLRETNSPNVSFVLGHGANARAEALSQPALGSFLGAISKASVHESVAWVEKFNFSNGIELESLAIGHKDNLLTDSVNVADLGEKGYLVLKKHVGIAGSYAYDSSTCALATSDYAFIENERTMDKATRNIRAKTLPSLARPLYLEAGKLREDTVAFFKATASEPLAQMQRDGEISEFAVIINPEQPILETSTLEIGVQIVPVGVARKIEFKIGFAVKVS